MCLHKYATKEDLVADWSNVREREESCYMCVTIRFKMGIKSKQYTECFIRTAKLVEWISRNKTNKKRVVV